MSVSAKERVKSMYPYAYPVHASVGCYISSAPNQHHISAWCADPHKRGDLSFEPANERLAWEDAASRLDAGKDRCKQSIAASHAASPEPEPIEVTTPPIPERYSQQYYSCKHAPLTHAFSNMSFQKLIEDIAVLEGIVRMAVGAKERAESELKAIEGTKESREDDDEVRDLLNSLKVVDPTHRHSECRCDRLSDFMYELVELRKLRSQPPIAAAGSPWMDELQRDEIERASWPKWIERVSRFEDMSPTGKLTLLRQQDGDVIVWIANAGQGGDEYAQIEFCMPMTGGGSSEHTHKALCALMVAMEKDEQERKQHREAALPSPGESRK